MIDGSFLRQWIQDNAPAGHIGVAVSGGGDSMAMLHLLVNAGLDRTLHAVTVDHGLRPEAPQEAQTVADFCKEVGVPHTIVPLDLTDGSNLQARARNARYDALVDWANRNDIGCVVLGHTKDDVAETFLLRLARGSGVAGLSAMDDVSVKNGVIFLRPLLKISRQELRVYLTDHHIQWVEDPSNDDPKFDRVRIRRALPDLSDLGLDVDRLVDTADAMSRARDALDWITQHAFEASCDLRHGCVLIDQDRLDQFPEDIQTRLVAGVVRWIGAQDYPPRLQSVQTLWSGERGQTLCGVQTAQSKDGFWLFREHNAIKDQSGPPDQVWDGRWRCDGDWPDGAFVAVAGESGQSQMRDLPGGLPLGARLSVPCIWHNGAILAGPDCARLTHLPF